MSANLDDTPENRRILLDISNRVKALKRVLEARKARSSLFIFSKYIMGFNGQPNAFISVNTHGEMCSLLQSTLRDIDDVGGLRMGEYHGITEVSKPSSLADGIGQERLMDSVSTTNKDIKTDVQSVIKRTVYDTFMYYQTPPTIPDFSKELPGGILPEDGVVDNLESTGTVSKS